jgi:hypothetical protein
VISPPRRRAGLPVRTSAIARPLALSAAADARAALEVQSTSLAQRSGSLRLISHGAHCQWSLAACQCEVHRDCQCEPPRAPGHWHSKTPGPSTLDGSPSESLVQVEIMIAFAEASPSRTLRVRVTGTGNLNRTHLRVTVTAKTSARTSTRSAECNLKRAAKDRPAALRANYAHSGCH